jgi:hypothetical protein
MLALYVLYAAGCCVGQKCGPSCGVPVRPPRRTILCSCGTRSREAASSPRVSRAGTRSLAPAGAAQATPLRPARGSCRRRSPSRSAAGPPEGARTRTCSARRVAPGFATPLQAPMPSPGHAAARRQLSARPLLSLPGPVRWGSGLRLCAARVATGQAGAVRARAVRRLRGAGRCFSRASVSLLSMSSGICLASNSFTNFLRMPGKITAGLL